MFTILIAPHNDTDTTFGKYNTKEEAIQALKSMYQNPDCDYAIIKTT